VGSVSGGGAPFVSSHFSISEDEITHFFSRKSLVWKRSGEELVVQTCPTCPDHKYKMDNLFKLYISKRTGQFFCHRCGNKGAITTNTHSNSHHLLTHATCACVVMCVVSCVMVRVP
jgi:twinkle protein